MTQYYNYIVSKEYYKKALPSMDSIASVKQYVLSDGPARGMRAIDVSVGNGFEVTILPDRGMDIGSAKYCGIPIAFMAKTGLHNQSNCVPGINKEFLHYFHGGLITTCGLCNVGPENEIDGVTLPMHGSHTYTAAENVTIKKHFVEDSYFIEVSGELRFASLFGENIKLVRTLKFEMGSAKIHLHDSITNEGTGEYGYMLLYHCNFGFPLVSEDSYFVSNHTGFQKWDNNEMVVKDKNHFIAPKDSFAENVYALEHPKSKEVRAAVVNPKIRLGGFVSCNAEELPCFAQWVQLSGQDYVLGIEPGKSLPEGRASAEKSNTLNIIEPGKTHDINLSIGVLVDEEINHYTKDM